jgi:hypothetical protein
VPRSVSSAKNFVSESVMHISHTWEGGGSWRYFAQCPAGQQGAAAPPATNARSDASVWPGGVYSSDAVHELLTVVGIDVQSMHFAGLLRAIGTIEHSHSSECVMICLPAVSVPFDQEAVVGGASTESHHGSHAAHPYYDQLVHVWTELPAIPPLTAATKHCKGGSH